MILNFHIEYRTIWGEQIAVQLRRKNGAEETILCHTYDGANWQATVQVAENEAIEYKYVLQTSGKPTPEDGEYRHFTAPKGQSQVFVQDFWRPSNELDRVFFSAAFKDVIFRRNTTPAKTRRSKKSTKNKIVFQLNAAAIEQHLHFCLLGNSKELGNWEKPILLSDEDFPVWKAEVEVEDETVNLEYKFAKYDAEQKQVVQWEQGENRKLDFTFPSANGNAIVRTDEAFRQASGKWHGAGVAIPVFSLRSKNGLGIGEFPDLKLMVDWAVKTGQKLVQTLPVNDTIATKKWTDSYPYAAISVFALHPLYVNLQAIAKLKDKKAEARLKRKITALNKLEAIDFEKVLKAKFEFFKLLYEQEKAAFWKNKEALLFIESNADWLKPYAAFCYLRDVNDTVKFPEWKKYATYSQAVINDLCDPKSKTFDEVALYYFIQFHAHQQLFGATEYARQHGVVLKGDLPIGIYRYSCDAWVAPHLYNMDGQAGAPPDAYSEDGQNWGFPTYNWQVMSEDNFEWWRQRMTKLAEYFDALRIDHILGFFRIWQIPTDQVIGTMGLFNPRLPYDRSELAGMGLHGNFARYTQPYVRGHFLEEMFGEEADYVRTTFLDEVEYSVFTLQDFVSNQLKIKELFESDKKLSEKEGMRKGLMKLVSEVLLIEEPGSNGMAFNPRITLTTTRSFEELSKHEQQIFEQLHNEYFFNRHDEFWRKQALWKLPALLQATNMFICGEDLGMIPASVPGVMKELNIIALEIQRMPRDGMKFGDTNFGDTTKYPYSSVCSPSCHDMSTIRGWWEEKGEHERTQQFYNSFFDPHGIAPQVCTPGIVEAINRQHLQSDCMWAIFPLQDLVGMDAKLRRGDATAEQINDPSKSPHYWKFRFHLPMEELLEADELNKRIEVMVHEARR